MYEQNASIFGEALRIRVTKCKQNLPENYSKSTKIVITASKFSKIFGVACPRSPLEPFLFLNQLQISSVKKIRSKKMWKLWSPSPFKISCYATGVTAIFDSQISPSKSSPDCAPNCEHIYLLKSAFPIQCS